MSEWKEYRIKDLVHYTGSGTTPQSTDERYYSEEGYSWINTGDLNNDIVSSTKFKITDVAIKENPTLRFYPKGTIVEAMYGATIGKVGMIDMTSTVNQACCAIVPNLKTISPKFLLSYLISYKDELIRESNGSTQPNVNQDTVRRIPVFMPSLTEQNRIVSYLDTKTSAIDSRISLLEQKCEAYERLKKSIINDVITRGLNPDVKMKDSGVEWIGEFPEHWVIKRFKEFASTQKGKQTDYLDEQIEGSDIVLTVETLRQDVPSFYNYALVYDKAQQCTAGDIVVIWDGAGVGEFLKAKKGVLSSTIAKINVDKRKILTEYLWLWRYNIEYELKSKPTGMGVPHLNPTILNNFLLPIPPIKEQQDILDLLNKKVRYLDSAISILNAQIEKYKLLKRSLINEVITGQREV